MHNDISRRKFIHQTSLGGLGLFMGGSLLNGINFNRLDTVGLIVNVLEKELKSDWQDTLRKVASKGYSQLEYGNYYGDSIEYFKKFMNSIHLQSLSGGSSMAEMKKEAVLNKMIEEALYLQKKYIVCYWPWMDDGNNKNLDDFKKAADDLNGLGEYCNKAGIRLAFHNHDKEFVPVKGYTFGYEVILNETEPQNVCMLLDLYWITKGGGDPVKFLEEYPNRFEIFHVKDMDNTSEKLYTCPGYGIIDFKKIFAAAEKTNVKYYIVEIDQTDNPMECIQNSYDYLTNLRF